MAQRRKRKAPKKTVAEDIADSQDVVAPSPPKNTRGKKKSSGEVPIQAEADVESNGSAGEDNAEYVVESIAGVCLQKANGGPEVLIKWQGFPIAESTWEPINHINDSDALEHFQPLIDKITAFKPQRGGGGNKGKKKKKGTKAAKDEEYEVEEVLGIWYDHEDDVIRYQIKWKDYPFSQNTWETEDKLTHCNDMFSQLAESIDYINRTFINQDKKPAGKRAGKRVAK